MSEIITSGAFIDGYSYRTCNKCGEMAKEKLGEKYVCKNHGKYRSQDFKRLIYKLKRKRGGLE